MNTKYDFDMIFLGNFIHCPKPFALEVLYDSYIAVKSNKIIQIGKRSELNDDCYKFYKNAVNEKILFEMKETQFLIPGFIDTHIHAPQYPNIGIGYDKQLLNWLNSYTYPLEKKFSNIDYAEQVYTKVVKDTLKFGTTTACYFGTIHVESCLKLVECLIKFGQRGFVGKVNMNQLCPNDYKETTQESLQNTHIFINSVLEQKSELVKPIVTPRFAISCDSELLKELGIIARNFNLNIQSHISESINEVKEVKKLFGGRNYTEVYNDADLLTSKTIMAHGIYLSDEELDIFTKNDVSISHCPTSNTCLKSGVLNVVHLWKKNINVALGTDVSGGYSISMMEVMRNAIAVSSQISFQKDPSYKPLDFKDVFYMSTLAGAKALNLDHKIGNFMPGKDFDAILVEIDQDNLSIEDRLQKFIYTGDDRHVKKVFVSGKRVC